MLFVLALVAVAAPVWSDLYVCPMERAARERTPRCCPKTAAVAAPLPGRPQFQIPCDCARLDWEGQTADNASRQSTPEVPTAFALPDRSFLVELVRAVAPISIRSESVAWSGPPLWVVNLSIRC